jgi:hypothetical protein
MMSGKEVSSGKNGTLREKKKYERFMGIQVKKGVLFVPRAGVAAVVT